MDINLQNINMSANDIPYLLSFLGILVQRAGGSLLIENLSDFAGMYIILGMKLDKENDKVILSSVCKSLL